MLFRSWRKALAAQQKGAVAVLFVDDVHNHREVPDFQAIARTIWPDAAAAPRAYTLADWADRIHIPAAQISRAAAERLIAPSGRSLEELSRAADQIAGYQPLPIAGTIVEIAATLNRTVIPERNVIGMIEGADPSLKDEWVIVSSHLEIGRAHV